MQGMGFELKHKNIKSLAKFYKISRQYHDIKTTFSISRQYQDIKTCGYPGTNMQIYYTNKKEENNDFPCKKKSETFEIW